MFRLKKAQKRASFSSVHLIDIYASSDFAYIQTQTHVPALPPSRNSFVLYGRSRFGALSCHYFPVNYPVLSVTFYFLFYWFSSQYFPNVFFLMWPTLVQPLTVLIHLYSAHYILFMLSVLSVSDSIPYSRVGKAAIFQNVNRLSFLV
jgi:hypothetical protein